MGHNYFLFQVPTFAINAEDDPFQPEDSIPKVQAETSSHVAILTTKYGGHVGWLEGWVPTGKYWPLIGQHC